MAERPYNENQADWAEYYREMAEDLERNSSNDRVCQDPEKYWDSVDHKVVVLLSSLGWVAGIAIESQRAEVVEAVATVVKYTRDL